VYLLNSPCLCTAILCLILYQIGCVGAFAAFWNNGPATTPPSLPFAYTAWNRNPACLAILHPSPYLFSFYLYEHHYTCYSLCYLCCTVIYSSFFSLSFPCIWPAHLSVPIPSHLPAFLCLYSPGLGLLCICVPAHTDCSICISFCSTMQITS